MKPRMVLASLVALCICASALQAGPQRDSSVNSHHWGAQNMNGDGTQGQALSEGGGEPDGNFCSVTIGPEKATWVRGVGRIVIIPTGAQYTRAYELKGMDGIIRTAQITGCEIGHWEYSINCWVRVTCEAGKRKDRRNDVIARGSVELRAFENGASISADVQECLVSSTCGTGIYTVTDSIGASWPGHCTETRMTDAPNLSLIPQLKGSASSVCAVAAVRRVDALNFQLQYQEYARVYMNVDVDHGHALVNIVHEAYTPLGSSVPTTNYWKVSMESFDDDDPRNSVSIRQYFFDSANNE